LFLVYRRHALSLRSFARWAAKNLAVLSREVVEMVLGALVATGCEEVDPVGPAIEILTTIVCGLSGRERLVVTAVFESESEIRSSMI